MLSTARLLLIGVVLAPALVFWLGRGDADMEQRIPARAGETLTVELALTGPFAWDRGTLSIEGMGSRGTAKAGERWNGKWRIRSTRA